MDALQNIYIKSKSDNMDFSTEYESKSKYYNEEQFNALIDAKNDFTILLQEVRR